VYTVAAKQVHHLHILAVDGGRPIQLTDGESDDIEPDIGFGPLPASEPETRHSPGLRAQ
jgi:hypothetical protein